MDMMGRSNLNLDAASRERSQRSDLSAGDVQPLSPLSAELTLPEERALVLWEQVIEGVSRYGFTVGLTDLGTVELTNDEGKVSARLPKTGNFDGLHIEVSSDLATSERMFTLLHLFGHSVQCCSPSEAAIVRAFFETPRASDEKLRALANYEFRAAQFSLQLLHELGVGDLDRWFTDFVHTDHKMVAQSYRTGALPPIRDCLVTNQELIRPAAIPADLKPGRLDRTSVAF